MRVLAFGTYERRYPRNAQVVSALRGAGVEVAERHVSVWDGQEARGARRVEVCLVGAEERLFKPGWRGGERFLFVGKLIPLHGLETILEAARLVPDLHFNVVGSGQLQPLLQRDRPANVGWTTWLVYEQLPAVLRGSKAALGIFGTPPKAARVIPNKAFQAPRP